MGKFFAVLLGFGIGGLFCGCTSMSAMQTAKVLPEGYYRFFAAAGFFRTPVTSPSAPNAVNYPFVEGGARFGFAPRWDLGLRYTLPGMLTGDVKACFFEDGPTALAVGAGVGYLAIPSKDATATLFGKELIDVTIPFYASYDFAPAFGVYASPRYVFRVAATEQHLIGSALGIRVGNRVGVFLEVSAALDLVSEYRQYQAGFSIFFGAAPHGENEVKKAQ
jgi:hypothetical protein